MPILFGWLRLEPSPEWRRAALVRLRVWPVHGAQTRTGTGGARGGAFNRLRFEPVNVQGLRG
jgi:hypothetical protein